MASQHESLTPQVPHFINLSQGVDDCPHPSLRGAGYHDVRFGPHLPAGNPLPPAWQALNSELRAADQEATLGVAALMTSVEYNQSWLTLLIHHTQDGLAVILIVVHTR